MAAFAIKTVQIPQNQKIVPFSAMNYVNLHENLIEL